MKLEQIIGYFPEYLVNPEEVEIILKEFGADCFDLDPSDVVIYNNYRDAFVDFYPGDIDSFKWEKCEDYNCLFSDYGDFYADWLEANTNCCWLSGNKILIIK